MRRHRHMAFFGYVARSRVGRPLRDRIAPVKTVTEEEDGPLLMYLETWPVIDPWKVGRCSRDGSRPDPVGLPPFSQRFAGVSGVSPT